MSLHRLLAGAVALAAGLASPGARADELPNASDYFSTTRSADAPTPACRAFVQHAFERRGSELKKEGFRTDGVVVVRGGQVRYEAYRAPFDRDKPHCLWSASKAVTSTLFAAATMDPRTQGHDLSLGTKLQAWFPRDLAREPQYGAVTLRDLLDMGAGFDWSETYEAGLRNSSVVRMYYVDGFLDMAGFALRAPMRPEGPGALWNYSSGNTNIVMSVLKKAYGDAYGAMPWDNLFGPLGAKNAVFERDMAGTFIGGTYVHLRPLDMAKFGQLYLQDGVWNGRRLFPEGWRAQATSVPAVYRNDPAKITSARDDGAFGAGFWLNEPVGYKLANPSPRDEENKPYPRTPTNMFGAMGHYGQYVLVFPTEDMVIARTGDDRDFTFAKELDEFMVRAVACFAGGAR